MDASPIGSMKLFLNINVTGGGITIARSGDFIGGEPLNPSTYVPPSFSSRPMTTERHPNKRPVREINEVVQFQRKIKEIKSFRL